MRIFILMTYGCAALILSGCGGASTNPREGGLFSYNPSAYEQRKQERRNTLNALETDPERTATPGLEQDKKEMADMVEKQARELADLDAELKLSASRLDRLKAENAVQQKKLNALKIRKAELDREFNQLNGSDEAMSEKQEKLKTMKEELRQLEEEAEALSWL